MNKVYELNRSSMQSGCDKLFVYGTLRSSNASQESLRLKKENRYMGRGYLKGFLYDIGGYPGAVYDEKAGTTIAGELFMIKDIERTFQWLDHYEEACPEYDPNLEYQRILVPVKYGERIVKAWMYQYSKPTKGFQQIPSGNYSAFPDK